MKIYCSSLKQDGVYLNAWISEDKKWGSTIYSGQKLTQSEWNTFINTTNPGLKDLEIIYENL